MEPVGDCPFGGCWGRVEGRGVIKQAFNFSMKKRRTVIKLYEGVILDRSFFFIRGLLSSGEEWGVKLCPIS